MHSHLPEDSSSSWSSEQDDVWSDDDAGYETDFTDPMAIADSAWLLADDDRPPEYYIQLAEGFDETEDAKEDYKPSTTALLDRIEEQWFLEVDSSLSTCSVGLTACRFCRYIRKDPHEAYQTVYAGLLFSFFDWLLSQKKDKRGRRKPGTKHKSSLGTYWKLYRLVYERATGEKIDGKLNRVMHRVIALLSLGRTESLLMLRCRFSGNSRRSTV